ncbi:MAG: hypothetical protein JXA13_00945, partial [Anaerolineales bacterium]|nr:hypothetical protein [Anaerolineales bacterium]
MRLGAIDPGSNVTGELYFDDYESLSFSSIGLVDAPDIDLPELLIQPGWQKRAYACEGEQAHAVTSVDSNTYTYDDNGNMTCRV